MGAKHEGRPFSVNRAMTDEHVCGGRAIAAPVKAMVLSFLSGA
jgi:hypothetical protein